MSELYDSIPPEQRDMYLANAERAFHTATGERTDQVVGDMGRLVIQDAEAIAKTDAEGDETIATKTAEFLENPDLLNDSDKRLLLAHDIANMRARGEHRGMSFAEAYAAAQRLQRPAEPQNISQEFARNYLAKTDKR